MKCLASEIDKTVAENLNLPNDCAIKSKDETQDGREEVIKNKGKIKPVKPKLSKKRKEDKAIKEFEKDSKDYLDMRKIVGQILE